MTDIKMNQEDVERRIRQYKNDPFIEGCRKEIERILNYAQPHIIVYINSPEKTVFDIDTNSKIKIAIWKERIEEYINKEYSDIKRC